MTTKTTLYLDTQVKKYLQHTAVANGTSVSALVNQLVSEDLEDFLLARNIEAVRKESTVSFEEALSSMGLTYDDLRN